MFNGPVISSLWYSDIPLVWSLPGEPDDSFTYW